MSAIITPERPDSADAIVLISELEAHLDPLYPAKSRHGYSVEKLLAQAVAFFVLRANDIPAGCGGVQDRKSTRLNSSHLGISYAVFCLKKKKNANNRWTA